MNHFTDKSGENPAATNYSEVSQGNYDYTEFDDEEYDAEVPHVAKESVAPHERSESERFAERALAEARELAVERKWESWSWSQADSDDDQNEEYDAEDDEIGLADGQEPEAEGPKAAHGSQAAILPERFLSGDVNLIDRATDAMLRRVSGGGLDGARLSECCLIAVLDMALEEWETEKAIRCYHEKRPFTRVPTTNELHNAYTTARKINEVELAAKKLGLGVPVSLLYSRRPANELIRGVLPAAQVGIISGPKNHLKTKCALDMCVSMASGTRWLDYFPVPQPVRCGIFAAEDSGSDVYEALQRICRTRGIDADEIENLVVSTDLPRIGSKDWLSNMRRFIEVCQLQSLCLEGVYLALGGADQKSLAAMGAALAPIHVLSHETGCAIQLSLHHKQGKKSGWPVLDDIAGVGYEQLARYWIQLNSRRPWNPATGQHSLRLVIGSKHREDRYFLDVREGHVDDDGGRVWEPRISIPDVGADASHKEQGQRGGMAQSTSKLQPWMDQARAVLRQHPDGRTMTAIGKEAKIPEGHRQEVIDALLASGEIEESLVKVSNQLNTRKGYKLCQPS